MTETRAAPQRPSTPPSPSPGVPVLCGSLSRFAVGLGRAMHEAAYQALGLDYRYQPFQIEDLPGAVQALRVLKIRGAGVSMPFKQQVLPYLDAIDPLAQRIGAVNTIVNDAGRLTGYNTDAWGARRAFEEVRPLDKCRVLLLGAGGAARALAFAFAEAGAHLSIANREGARAKALAQEVGAVAGGGLQQLADLEPFEALVNASSHGMHDVDPSSPLEATRLRSDQIVMDIVYKPIETCLLREARARGCSSIHGGRMLLHQATRQFELYTGCPAPVEVMDAELRRTLAALEVA